ncbi:hypothetical protein MG293_011098 [Ovis ammon polii]|uniref:Uncharacterized protein n=1 Tax=Ovis ammon polii TaxID=230172 RepID=A0AAD4U5H1_OVIAM|nr:hypothetical protein MG293_011098 [Ovis ammon polii]KAI4565249.1 hypothetical protein MJT46_009592 [Ovis ammon polii x Ovis aries]
MELRDHKAFVLWNQISARVLQGSGVILCPRPLEMREASVDQIVETGGCCLLLNCDLVIFKPPVLSTVLAPQSLVPRSLSLQNPAPSPVLCGGESEMCLSVLQVLGELRWSRQAPCVSAGERSGRPVCRAHGPCAFRWGSSVDLTSTHTLFFPLLHPRSNQGVKLDGRA